MSATPAIGIENTFIFVEFAFNSCQIYTTALLWPPLGVGPKPRRPDLILTTLVSGLQGVSTILKEIRSVLEGHIQKCLLVSPMTSRPLGSNKIYL